MNDFVTVGDVAARLGVAPRVITRAFYDRQLDVDRCPIIAGRRMIPADYIDAIKIELRRSGKLPRDSALA